MIEKTVQNTSRVTFKSFTLGDVEDPELFVALPISDWQQTDQGSWVMEHASDLTYDISPDITTYGYRVRIHGIINDKDLTYYYLRWGG